MSSRVFSGFVLVAAIAVSPAAFAQDSGDDERFTAATKAGYDQFDAGNFPAARAEFEKAYQIRPDPMLLFNIASTYRREGNDKVALAYYTKFLDVAPKDHPQRRLAEEVADVLRDKLKTEQNQTSGGGGGGPADDNIVSTPQDTPRKPGTTLIWSGIGVGGLGVIGIGYAVFQGQKARDRNNTLEQLSPGSQWTDERIKQFEEGESAEKQAIVFSILGTAAVATGATLFILGMQKRKKASTEREGIAVMPYAGDESAGVSLLGWF